MSMPIVGKEGVVIHILEGIEEIPHRNCVVYALSGEEILGTRKCIQNGI